MTKSKILILVIMTLIWSGMAFGQEVRHGTNSASELLVPVGAQYLQGGGAAALASGLEGALWNPAALDKGNKSVMAVFSHRSYIADIGINFAGVGGQFGSIGAVGLSLRSFDIGEIPVTDEYNMDGTGATFSPTVFILGGIYSKQLADRIRVGATVNLVNETIAEVEAQTVTFDAGVQYSDFLDVQGLSIGVAVRNVGSAMQFDGPGLLVDANEPTAERGVTKYKITAMDADMPTVADLGIVYKPIDNLDIGVSYLENNYGPNSVKMLGAYHLGEFASARVSYQTATESDQVLQDIFAGVSYGASLNLEPVIGTDLALDYGFLPVEYFNNNHVFSLRFGL
ncbi:MAG: PorV/PorQ family protein [Candidatus Marinimicrobia bacterium]|nr:PorV/PorQ family protein [Candidatus Neomarinimicrobiota bacterium]MCF7828200.1 PorV/PorQ family protein [Candidatus Neomarinimicrobiota bacterium]MCF7879625.1 PorV/PorQ family protein [Candidatus Neomarinimicrobiota bacterium]